ncbi:hypothetical protein [Phaeodactylibacter xiamenensis]|uniref:hypothetical protein n=1 Tax=Phaeodactylibacter xiamenensis TaxID=1524460 RepID=UPI003BA8508A
MSNVEPAYKEENFVFKRPPRILELASTLTPLLNELHDVSYSASYWLATLHRHLTACINRRPYLEQENGNEKYGTFGYSKFHPLPEKVMRKQTLLYILKALRYRSNFKKNLKLLGRHDHILLGDRAQKLAYYKEGVVMPALYPVSVLFSGVNRKKRKKLEVIANRHNSRYIRNCLLSTPKIYVEYYDAIIKSIPVISPESKTFHFEHLESFYSEFLVALYREKGAKVVRYQTGGFMGELQYSPNEVFYAQIDELRTYGWKNHPKDFPDKPFRLIEYLENWKKHRPASGIFDYKILIVMAMAVTEQSKDSYNHFFEHFFTSIPDDIKEKVLVRPLPKYRFMDNSKQARVLNIPFDIQLDKGDKPMVQVASQAELIVLTGIPSTTFLECLYAGQPVITLNTNTAPSELFSSYIPDLTRLGILHNDVESLIDKVLGLEDINSWWKDVESDKRFIAFLKHFCGKEV